ncbi:MAG: leucine-rich repeat domain-containing protein, partial [Muribaculaceae bacterium]|nr:leucine-rich repeat domain-containing protein [Muribaculaceae bacterium]
MRQKLLLLLLGVLSALPALARDFEYTYEGQTITYTVINEDDKTCMTKEGYWQLHGEIIYYCGNNVNGDLVLPDHPKDGDVEYTLTQIGQISFYGCKSLTSVVIPSSVRIIDKFAFTGCRGLKKAEFSNIESLCNISFGDVDANPLYYAEHLYIGGDEVTELVIPESVTSIGAYAFYNCSGLKSVVIGNSVKTIGKSAFYGCSGLTSVEIGNSVEWIGNQAFYECSSLESVVIGNSVETIGDKAFYNCSSLTSLEIPNSVTTIDRYAFEKCRSLTSVVLGNSVEGIGDQAFAECRGLTSLVIPNSVKTIGKKAFYSCSGMTSVVIGKSVRSIGSDAFNGSNLKKSAYPNSLDNPFYSSIVAISYDPKEAIIEDGWIWGPEKTAVYFAPLSLEGEYLTPESVQTIDRNAFYGCSGLTSVVIPNSVKTIGWSAFKGCSGLKKSAYPNSLKNPFEDGTAISYNPEGAIIEDGWIWGPEKTSVYFAPLSLEGEYTIPESVTSIGESAFYGCSGLTSVTALSVSPAAMDDDSFQGLYDTVKLTVPDDAVNNYLATKWGLFKNIQNNSGKELGYFSDGVLEYRLNPVDMTATVIGAKDNSNLQIPERFTDDTDAANLVRYIIKGIEYKAFDGKDVASVEFNSRSKMEYIGDYAFANTKIPSITLPETMKSIGEYAFHNVSDLKEVVLNEGLTQIGDYSFAGTRLTSISIPGSVKAIGDYAFYDTRSLSKIELPEGIETIGEYSFA